MVKTTNQVVANALAAVAMNWSKFKDFKVGDTVEAIRDKVHKLGVKGKVTRVGGDVITVKWSDDGFEATYGIDGNFKNLTPPPKQSNEEKLRWDMAKYGAHTPQQQRDYLMRLRRGIQSKYGREAYDRVWAEMAKRL